MPHLEPGFAATASNELNYTITPSGAADTTTAELLAVTATYNGQHFEIEPTPWGTLFKRSHILRAAIHIDAFIEQPVKDKAKLLPTSTSMIHVKASSVVPHGAKLVRVAGSNELWRLYFPPKPVFAGAEEKPGKEQDMDQKTAAMRGAGKDEVVGRERSKQEAEPVPKGKVRIGRKLRADESGKGKQREEKDHRAAEKVTDKASAPDEVKVDEQSKGKTAGKSSAAGPVKEQRESAKGDKDAKWQRPGKFAPDFAGFLKAVRENPGADEAFFDEYAIEVGSGVTADEVRAEFAKELANPDLRGLYPNKGDDFWDELWRLASRDGTLEATAGRDWRDGQVEDSHLPSNIDIARISRQKHVSRERDYGSALGHAICEVYEDSRLQATLRVFKSGILSRTSASSSDEEWAKIWSVTTRRGKLKGGPTLEEFEKWR